MHFFNDLPTQYANLNAPIVSLIVQNKMLHWDKVDLKVNKPRNNFIAKDIYLLQIIQVAFLAVRELAVFSLHISDIQFHIYKYILDIYIIVLPRKKLIIYHNGRLKKYSHWIVHSPYSSETWLIHIDVHISILQKKSLR